MQKLDITGKRPSVRECDTVPDMFVSGPANVMSTGGLVVITLTNVRADVAQLMSGNSSPDLHAVVAARLVMPLANAEELARLLSSIVPSRSAPAA
jgi:hypothetical protein